MISYMFVVTLYKGFFGLQNHLSSAHLCARHYAESVIHVTSTWSSQLLYGGEGYLLTVELELRLSPFGLLSS